MFILPAVENVSSMWNQGVRGYTEVVAPLGTLAPQVLQYTGQLATGAGIVVSGALAGMGTVGGMVAGAPIAMASAIASAIGVAGMSIWKGTYRAQLGANYWRKMQMRDKNGKNIYTHDDAVKQAKDEAFWQATIETALDVSAFGRISKMYGGNVASQIIKNEGIRRVLTEAGIKSFKDKIARISAKETIKNISLGVGEQVVQEGLQDAVTTVNERVSGKVDHSMNDILESATDAMIEALPAAIGMIAPSAIGGGLARYKGLKNQRGAIDAYIKNSPMGAETAKQEIAREREQGLISNLIKARNESKLFKSTPDLYTKTLTKQLKAQNMDTLYVNVAQASETEEGRRAINELVSQGLVSEKSVNKALQDDTPLEVNAGMYFQKATEETANAMMDYTTMTKDGLTMKDIKEERERLNARYQEFEDERSIKESQAIEEILTTFAPEEGQKETLASILNEGLEHVEYTYREKVKETEQALEDLTPIDGEENGDYEDLQKRIKALKELKPTIDKIKKSDINARISLSRESFKNVYEPFVRGLKETNEEVAQGARDSAFLLAKMVDRLSQDYHIPVTQLMPTLNGHMVESENVLHQTTTAQEKLDRDIAKWEETIDKLKDNKPLNNTIPVMHTPLSLQMLGAKSLPLVIKTSKIKKILKTHPEMTLDVFKQIPKALTNPIMILDSATVKGRLVVALELTGTNGVNVVVPCELNTEKERIDVNLITSAYTKTRGDDVTSSKFHQIKSGWFRNEIEKGNLRYVDKTRANMLLQLGQQKTTAFLQSAGLQLPLEYKKNGSSSKITILDETDLVKYKENNSSYYQKTDNKTVNKGAYDYINNAIHVFDGADKSTVLHESAHFYLTTLQNLATSSVLPSEEKAKIQADIKTIEEWASYSKEVMEEYKGTPLEKEFKSYEKAVKKGEEGARERFIQERFARGFERYILEGKAPTKELRSVFRRFSKWLKEIYQSLMSLGKIDPPEEVRVIFDKMVATDEEIEKWQLQKKLLAIDKVGINFNQTEEENLKRWEEEIKDSIRERSLSLFMKQYKEGKLSELDEQMETARDLYIKGLVEENEVYKIEQILNSDLFPTALEKKNFLANYGYTKETFEKALMEHGGTSDVRADAYIEDLKKKYVDSMLTPEMIRNEADKKLNSPEGLEKMTAEYSSMMKKRINQYIRQATTAALSLERVTDAKDLTADLKERLGISDTEARIGRAEEKTHKAEVKLQDLREKVHNHIDALKAARKLLDVPVRQLEESIINSMSKQNISKATNWKYWNNRQKSVTTSATREIRKGNWANASYWINEGRKIFKSGSAINYGLWYSISIR